MQGKVRSVKYSFDPSGSPDVGGYKLYWEEAPTEVTYESQMVDLGPLAPDTDGKVRVDLVALGIFTQDTNYNFGVVAYDDVGNESSMLKELDVPFDLVVPDAPTNGVVERT